MLIGFTLLYPFYELYEPLWALPYLFNIVSKIIDPNFAELERITTWHDGVRQHVQYNFPNPEGAVIGTLLYFIFSYLLALYVFTRREKTSLFRFHRFKTKLNKWL